MYSVQTAGAIIIEVRRQFEENPGLRDGTAAADSDACIEIATRCSIQEMILPGVYAVFAPVTIGFLVGPNCLAGLLGGAIASGMMLGTMMSNGGGAWDNAKKYIEIEGAHGGKGSPAHKACIVGDTVGDPFKDTSGPSLNILIKLMSIVALTVAPSMKGADDWDLAAWGIIPLFVIILVTCSVKIFQWRKSKALESQTRNVSCIIRIFLSGWIGSKPLNSYFFFNLTFKDKDIGDLELLLHANANEPLSKVI